MEAASQRHVDRHDERHGKRHRKWHGAPALWLVAAAVAAVCGTAVAVGAQQAVLVLSGTLLLAAGARVVRRGRLPEGLAVRSTGTDVAVLLLLAVATALLSRTPGVAG